MSELTNEELVQKYKAAPTHKLAEEIIVRFEKVMYLVMRRTGVRKAEREDVRQELRLELLRIVLLWEPGRGAKIITWVMRGLFLRALRLNEEAHDWGGSGSRRSGRAIREGKELPTWGLPFERLDRRCSPTSENRHGDLLADSRGGPEDEVLSGENSVLLTQAISDLNERQRQAILTLISGQKIREAAKTMGVSHETVRQLRIRAFINLRKSLRQLGFDPSL